MENISRMHIQSFDFMVNQGFSRMLNYLPPTYFEGKDAEEYTLSIKGIDIVKPRASNRKNLSVFPHECRRTGQTYGGNLVLSVSVKRSGVDMGTLEIQGGQVPVMVLSNKCNLAGMPRSLFPKNGEEERELGGYFIVNGNERVLRLLIMARRNYPLAIMRPSFKKRGKSYTEFAIIVRCVRDDEHSATMILHWVTNSEPKLAFAVENEQLYVPISILLRALMSKTDLEIFEDIVRGGGTSLSLEENAMRILLRLQKENYTNQEAALVHLGQYFRGKMHLPKSFTDIEAAQYLFDNYVAIHLKKFSDKYHLFCYMIRKLHAFVSGACCEESNDNLMFQEVLLPGTLYISVLRNRLLAYLASTKDQLTKAKDSLTIEVIRKALNRSMSEVTGGMLYFISNGNLPGTSRMVLGRTLGGQSSGLSVPLDTINFLRVAAQFRAVHRGAAFADIRTTSVRRLLPEAWGFICPVHTPDGAPCGLLNHLADATEAVCITPSNATVTKFADWLRENHLYNIEVCRAVLPEIDYRTLFPVLLDGRLVGWCPDAKAAQDLAKELRVSKVDPHSSHVPSNLEICFVAPTDTGSQYPGLYLFLGGSRLLRPVKSLVRVGPDKIAEADIEMVGTFEQPYTDIAVTMEELLERPPQDRTHFEVSPEAILSFVASLTPYPDFNQSPRNMYQCQMAKQTMGHSSYTWRNRSDPKAYRLLTPQKPLVRTKNYDRYDVDHYPLGFNAIVAVMSYTGYDMEDAMVINKSSYERGFADACIYKSISINLAHFSSGRGKRTEHSFGGHTEYIPNIDSDGFPPIGTRLIPGKSILYVYTHMETRETTALRYKDGEQVAYVDAVSLHGGGKACITLRLPRRPDIGDKYSSRHGQKGINSILISAEDMPWTVDSGIVPDLIFNPHGFPTRMTMGMMIEFLAGKAATLRGQTVDATPFQWSEEEPPFEEYAEQLSNAGFNYWGTEAMMSGITGRLLEAHIFIGVVYYQRLRHMVADKYQVRAEGRFDAILRQPVKGRKVGGGVRLGEMERDCLLSQGLCITLHDRMLDSNSDKVKMLVCSKCGGLIHEDLIRVPQLEEGPQDSLGSGGGKEAERRRIDKALSHPLSEKQHWYCRVCHPTFNTTTGGDKEEEEEASKMLLVDVPSAFRFLTYELACLNVRTCLKVKEFT